MRSVHVILALVFLVIPLRAFACSCAPTTPSERYESSQVVFTGDAIRYVKSERGPAWTILRFTPVEAWKGANGPSIDIEVPTKDGSCSVEVLIGHRYLVYAKAESDGTLLTTLCMGTRQASSTTDDLKFLRSLHTMSSPFPPKSFSDVPSDAPYAQAIHDFRGKGIVKGYPDGSFRPDRSISRAEIAKILSEHFLPQDAIWRSEGEHAFTNSGLPFTDIDERAWYNLGLRRSYRAGLIKGYPDGTFRPAKPVTVAEATKLIAQALQIDTPADGAVWYERYIRAVGERRALPTSIRSVDLSITRGEFVEMLWRLSQHVTDRVSLTADDLMNKKCVQSEDSTIPSVDLRRVRETWLSWYNDLRTKRHLPLYTFDPYLTRSAALWSVRAADQGFIDHARDSTMTSYSYEAVRQWFHDLGLDFRNVAGITFTENVGWGPYRCTDLDCTDELLAAIRTTFDFYISEEDRSYRPHFNAIVNPSFTITGLGIAVRDGKYYLTAHFGTEIVSSPPRLCPLD